MRAVKGVIAQNCYCRRLKRRAFASPKKQSTEENYYAVIPAKAGKVVTPTKVGVQNMDMDWMPAFAGMTARARLPPG